MIGIDIGATTVTTTTREGDVRRSLDLPEELLCRVGEDLPCVMLGEDDFELKQAHEVVAEVTARTVAEHRGATGEPADPAALAVPGWWTPRALRWVGLALESEGLGDIVLVNDGEAAVRGHVSDGTPLPETVAVVSLRAEFSSVVIVEQCTGHPRAVRSPALVHVEGGNRLDGTVLHHLLRGLGDLGVTIDRDDPDSVAAAREVLQQCREVRETLSTNAVQSVQPAFPAGDRRLRLVRSELEELAEPWVDAVVRMVATAADQYPQVVDAVLLVGGLAAMPLVSQRISADLGLEVVVPRDPDTVVARGTAQLALATDEAPARRRWGRRVPAALPTSPAQRGRRKVDHRRRRRVAGAELPSRPLAALPPGPSSQQESVEQESSSDTPTAEPESSTPRAPFRPAHREPGPEARLPRGAHVVDLVVPLTSATPTEGVATVAAMSEGSAESTSRSAARSR